MKRIVCFFLIAVLCTGLLGCSQSNKETGESAAETIPEVTQAEATQLVLFGDYKVAEPLEYPDYTFDHEPTIDEMRQMAVKAMHDMISVQWCVGEYTTYRKTSTGSKYFFEFLPTNTYAGVPYSNADGSLIQWFEFYDPETGLLDVGGDGQVLNESVGNTCAGSVAAGWSVVCASIEGPCGSGSFTPKYNYVPVGGYQSMSVDTFNSFPTDMILEMNGREKMFSCYAQVLPADGLCSTPDVHAMMAIEPAHVEYTEDGAIDPDKSYITIQDQRMGHAITNRVESTENGYLYYAGSISKAYTFNELWDLGYIPVTTQEFAGLRPYEAPEVSFSVKNCETAEDVISGNVVSNYPICVARMYLTDSQGEKTLLERVLLTKWDIPTGLARNFPIRQFNLSCTSEKFLSMLEPGQTYTLSYEVSVANGQVFTPVSIEVVGQ